MTFEGISQKFNVKTKYNSHFKKTVEYKFIFNFIIHLKYNVIILCTRLSTNASIANRPLMGQ